MYISNDKESLIKRVKQEETIYNELLTLAKVLTEALKLFEGKTVNKRIITKANDLLAKENHNMYLHFDGGYITPEHGWRGIKVLRKYPDGTEHYDFFYRDYNFRAYMQNNKLIFDETIESFNNLISKHKNELAIIKDAAKNYDSYIQMINDLNDHIKTFNLNYNRYICDRVFI